MSSRQGKNDINIKESNTLENQHMKKIKQINEVKKNKKKYEEKYLNIINELEKIDLLRENNKIIDLEYRTNLLNERDELQNIINNINNNDDEINYYDLTGDILEKYYDIRNDNSNVEIIDITSLFNTKNNNSNNNKTKLFEKYCQRVDGIRVNKDDGSNRVKYCEYCNIELILEISISSYVCSNCGLTEFVLIDEDRIIKEYSPYERINHFKDWLKLIQAKENVEISDEIFNKIINELNKSKYILKNKTLTRKKIQNILKDLGYNKLYKHIPFIINKITGKAPPTISKEMEDKFIKMFEMIQEPWDLYKPAKRSNFISYPYILYKFCELLEIDELLPHLPLLDDPNLSVPDSIWKKICEHLKWEFYPTEL